MEAAFLALVLLMGEVGVQNASRGESNGQPTSISVAPGFFSGALAVVGSFQSEVRAGETPILAGLPPQPFAAEVLTPRLALDLRRPDLDLLAWYSPRIFWEQTTTPLAPGPMILHTVSISLDARPSRTVTTTGAATGSIGEADYTALPPVLGTVLGTIPPVVKLASVSGQGRIATRLTDLWELSLAAQIFYWRWLDIQSPLPPSTVTNQTSVSGQPAATYRLSPRDALALGAAIGETSYSQSEHILTVSPAANWRRALARRVNLDLILGMTYAQVLGSPPAGTTPPLGASGSAASPIGSVGIVSRLARRGDVMFEGRALAGVDFFLDPVLGVGLPRALAGAELTLTSVPDLTTSLRGDFATPFEAPPVPTTGIPYDVTTFTVAVSVRRRVTENFYAELGGRWADRGPALQTPDFQFHQRQLWIYLSITGTTQPIPRPALPL